jgi:dipeptide/tripeptide permease
VIAAGTFYGLLLWLINFYVIAPPARWVWFPTMANPVQQLISHVFAFGTVLASTSIMLLLLGARPFQQRRERRTQGYRRSFFLCRRYSS